MLGTPDSQWPRINLTYAPSAAPASGDAGSSERLLQQQGRQAALPFLVGIGVDLAIAERGVERARAGIEGVGFQPRHGLDNSSLAELFLWSEEEFLSRTEGSPLRRSGYENWLRNLAVGLGNAPSSIPVLEALKTRREHPSALVREHVEWALRRHEAA